MTGNIQFSDTGKRENYTLSIMKLLPAGDIVNIGEYTPPWSQTPDGSLGLFPIRELSKESFKNKVLKVSTIIVSSVQQGI